MTPSDNVDPVADLFIRCGEALFGSNFKTPLAVALDVRIDTIDAMAKGKSRIPPGIWIDIDRLIRQQTARAPALLAAIGVLGVSKVKTDLQHEVADLSPALCRAATAFLGWDKDLLSQASGVPSEVIARFQTEGVRPRAAELTSLIGAIELGGIQLLPESELQGAGLRRRSPEFEINSDFAVYNDGVAFGARYRGQRFRFLVPDAVLDDLIRGHASTEAAQLAAARRFRGLIFRQAEKAAALHDGQGSRNIVLGHQRFPVSVF